MLTIGVLGGMGPAAGVDFCARVVAAHDAPRDQDHPPCILYSATQVPDRTAFLSGEGPDPAPALVAAARTLEAAGADFIAIPCNSAHAFLDAIRAAVEVPILDMIALAAAAAAEIGGPAGAGSGRSGSTGDGLPPAVAVPGKATEIDSAAYLRRVGVLAASGTVRARLYDEPLRRRGLEPVYPAADEQEQVMAAIRDVKAGGGGGRPSGVGGKASGSAGGPGASSAASVAQGPAEAASDPRLVAAARHLQETGAGCLILGCTEVPLALAAAACPIPAIDANQVLAETALALALGTLDFADCEAAGSSLEGGVGRS